ncbi:polysaccharide biosynthesis/export family protein [Microvirga zambiensis]|uniref:polysaccharide biosynthesis/export family protein n=1 Tax=Microvirga zambiensis TaxID=1402137 RepID=UPI00191E1B47|nr:polysaccharide biosynthesis/export family protein [Microvirga zambiensis]
MRFNTSTLCGLLCSIAMIGLPIRAAADDYRLGPQDKLRIRVVEWRAGSAEYFDWAVFANEYAVSASGTVSLPLIGSLPATGRTTEEFATSVAETLQKRAGLLRPPEATVEIVQYRPVYVVGTVQHSGEYPYRPGMTVLQAIGLAGGIFQQPGTEAGRTEKDRITAQGVHEIARLDARRLLVRRARLGAELEETRQIATPEELRNDADVARLIETESAVMNARSEALKSQLLAFSEIRNLFSREVEALEQKIEVQNRQIALARREQQTVSALVNKGLAVTSREFALERTLADLESKLLDYTTAVLRARQEISKAERAADDLKAERKARIVTEKQDTEAQIDQSKARLTTALSLINAATDITPQLLLEKPLEKPTTVFTVIRRVGTNTVKTVVDDTAMIEPGDVVQVDQVVGESVSPGKASMRAATEESLTR